MLIEIQNKNEKREISRKILQALPDWFGIPQSTEEYIEKSADMPFWAAVVNNEQIGFVAFKKTSDSAGEIYVMGILPQFHKNGIGRKLVEICKTYCKENKLELLQVKTLDKSFKDEFYGKTRRFYESVGFKPLECIPEIWGAACPCLVMVMNI